MSDIEFLPTDEFIDRIIEESSLFDLLRVTMMLNEGNMPLGIFVDRTKKIFILLQPDVNMMMYAMMHEMMHYALNGISKELSSKLDNLPLDAYIDLDEDMLQCEKSDSHEAGDKNEEDRNRCIVQE